MASDDHRSAAEIEREIESERAALTDTLDEIQDRLSFEYLSNDLVGKVRENSGDIGRAVMRSVKDNPIPLAITAIGLAWLIVGQTRSSGSDRLGSRRDRDYEYDPYANAAARPGAYDWEDDDYSIGGTGSTPGRYGAETRRPIYDASGRPITGQDDGGSRWDSATSGMSDAGNAAGDRLREGRDAATSSLSSAASSASSMAGPARDSAASGFSSASNRARSGLTSGRDSAAAGYRYGRDSVAAGYESGRSAMSAGAGRAKAGWSRASDEARRRARGAYASAAELRERITHGTENLSEQARRRVIAARTRAYEAQLRAEHLAGRGREKAADLFEEQPLVAGALAMAVGAAIGGLLPHTRREDEALGGYRDQLFEEAERVYRSEREKIESVARETAAEARRVAEETAEDVKGDLKEAAQRTGDIAREKLADAEARTKEGAERVAETAKKEAEEKKLGQG